MKQKQKEIAVEHLKTGININKNNVCSKCPYRIYANAGDTVTLGTGNIFSKFIFVLPTYDTKTKVDYDSLLSVLAVSYQKIKGRSLFEDIYVTRLVKCDNRSSHSIYFSAISSCSHYLIYELAKLNAKHVVFFGSAYDDYENANDNTIGSIITNKYIHRCFSPAVMFYDNQQNIDKYIDSLSAILNN